MHRVSSGTCDLDNRFYASKCKDEALSFAQGLVSIFTHCQNGSERLTISSREWMLQLFL